MREARWAEHGGLKDAFQSVPAPPGMVMVAPPEVPRNE
jgi:hypothetical protein